MNLSQAFPDYRVSTGYYGEWTRGMISKDGACRFFMFKNGYDIIPDLKAWVERDARESDNNS